MLKTNEPTRTPVQRASRRSPLTVAVIVACILLLSLNLRAPLNGVGPLIEQIRVYTGLSSSLVGLLTTLPLLTFAFFSPFAPRLAQRWGLERVLFLSLVILTIGVALRFIPAIPFLFLGTAILGLAITAGNVLLPGFIKRDFPRQASLLTGIYTTVMSIGAALASGTSVPLSRWLGWNGALAFWALPAAIAALLWLTRIRDANKPELTETPSVPFRLLLRSTLVWKVTLFMGLQSLLYYVTISWLPALLHDKGLSATDAGLMLSLLQLMALPAGFIVPIIAARYADQRALVVIIVAPAALAFIGFATTTGSWLLLCSILLGLSLGGCLTLALLFFILRTTTTPTAASLSGLAQSLGYLLAAIGPTLFGALHDLTNGWLVPLYTLFGISSVLLLAGLGAGRNRSVESTLQ